MRGDGEVEIVVTIKDGANVTTITAPIARSPWWEAQQTINKVDLIKDGAHVTTPQRLGADCRLEFFARSGEDGVAYKIEREPLRPKFDFEAHLARQREFSERTFGPGARTKGVIDHIRKELDEVAADPFDLTEWIDLVILALDGAWRHGGSPSDIIDTLVAKQARNEQRTWPDWRTLSENQAIEHDRTEETE